MNHLLDPIAIIESIGLLGVTLIIFAESGLFFGFFLPGDSLLFTAGLFASQGKLNIFVLLAFVFIAAVCGDSAGYWFGSKVGERFLTREDSFFFKRKHVEKTKLFYEKYGKKTIILARFLPVVRSFAPILAGIGVMQYRIFLSYNVIGAFLWTFGLTLLGYVLGNLIPDIDKYLLPIIGVIVVISFLPSVVEIIRAKRRKTHLTS